MAGKHIEKYKKLPIQAKAACWFFLCAFLQKGISTITTPVFTRLLTTDEYGRYTGFNSWLGIATIFVSMNLSYGVYGQGLTKFSGERDVFSSSLQGLTLTLTAIWTAIYLAFRSFWNELFSLTTVQMLAMLVMIWATAVFGFWSSEQRVTYRYRALAAVTLLVSVAKPAVGIFLVYHARDKVTARILGLALVELVVYSGLFFVQMRRGKVFYSAKYWKYAVAFNLPLIPHYLSQTVLSSADRIMIQDMVGDSAAGIYGLAYSISLVMTLFNSAMSQTMAPWLYQKIKERREHDIAGVSYISLLLIAAVNLLLIALAPEVVAVFAPPEYRDAIWVIPPVAMSTVFMFSYDLFAKFEFYYEKTQYIMVASIFGAVLNVVLNYLFIPVCGYYAAGYTTLVCYIIYVLAHYMFMRKVCVSYLDGVKVYDPKILLSIYIGFIFCGFVLMLTYRCPIVRYGIIAAAMIALFLRRGQIVQGLRQLLSLRKRG